MSSALRLEAASELQLVTGLETVMSRRDAILLSQIRQNLSLQCAAQITGIGYRQAMARLREMNAFVGQPLATSRQGGLQGGGSRLTPVGEKILGLYQDAAREHQVWLGDLNQRLRPELAWTLG